MFYKIKINYNKSELSLTCLNKDMIEREMDLYFAFFANASKDFVSRIKKIKNVHPKIKPIDEIVSCAVDKKQDLTNDKIESALIVNQNYELEKINNSCALGDSAQIYSIKNSINSNNDVESIKFNNSQTEEINTLEYNTKETSNIPSQTDEDIVKKYGFDNLGPDFSPNYSKIQNMVKLAQSRLDANDLKEQIKTQENLNNPLQDNIKDNPNNDLLQHFVSEVEIATEDNYRITNDEDFENTQSLDEKENKINTTAQLQDESSTKDIEILSDLSSYDAKIVPPEPNNAFEHYDFFKSQAQQKEKDKEDFLNDIFSTDTLEETDNDEIKNTIETKKIQSITPIDSSSEFRIEQPSEAELKEFAMNLDNALQKSIKQEEELVIDNNEEIILDDTSSIIPVESNFKKQENQKESDFSIFLAMFEPNSISDEFLICAYFIKNILKKSSFTMKYINAKLFKASGTIAGISIVEKLVNNGFITEIKEEDNHCYTISELGEKYFKKHFQRR